jgi:peptidoglycan/xylan/chitin deacetylase (PgdA/CDA1 family)
MTERQIPILAYHSFSGSASKAWQYALEPDLFDEHCAYLRERNFFSLTLSECVQSKEMAVSARPVVLTFNGAFADFERVLPILKKYQFSATLFVPTAFVGKQSSWLDTGQQRPLMAWEALRGLANIEIASLGHEHLHLTQVSESAAKEDIARSKELLEDNLGLPCQSFAYPFGEVNPALIGMVKAAGFLSACTLQPEVSNVSHDSYALPRFAMTPRLVLSDIVGAKAKSRFSLLDLFRPQRQRRSVPVQPPRYIPPPLPTKVTTEQVRQERSQQVSRPSLEPLSQESSNEGVQARREGGQVAPTHTPLPPRSFRESVQEEAVRRVSDLEQQGDFLADLKTWIAQQQGKHLIEYNMLLGAAQRLQASQEAGVFAPERVRAVYQAQAKLEAALTGELNQVTQYQRVRLQKCLETLDKLPRLEALHTASDNAKQIVQEYLDYLTVAALSDDVIESAEQLVQSLEQRINASYRSGLQKLVQDATKAKAMDFLVTLQRTGNALDQGTYPDLNALAQSLDNIVHVDRSQQMIQQRSQKFVKELANAARVFETVSALNNEDVSTVRQLLYYLLSQREVFPKVSATMQQELENSLKEAKELLERLEKDHQATRTVASQLVTENIFDNLFGEDDTDKR